MPGRVNANITLAAIWVALDSCGLLEGESRRRAAKARRILRQRVEFSVGIVEVLKGAFAPGTRLRVDDIVPFLPGAGGVPPWERNRVPLLYVNEDIAAVVGYCVCEPYQAGRDEDGVNVTYADS